jgi:nitrogen regulatory protein P-II 1
MKRIDIIIPQEHLNELNKLLHKHRVGGLSFFDIKGRGKSKQMPVAVGRGVMYYIPEFGYRTKLDVVVPDSLVKPIVDDVLDKFGTGASAIGKIFVYNVTTAYDIGTTEEGDRAL